VIGVPRRDLAERVRGAFRAEGVEAEVHLFEGRRTLNRAREVDRTGLDAVVAGGGDGTISAVAGILAGGTVPLGILPIGTLNHFAKDLGIPLALDEAVRVVANGIVRPVDIGEVNGQTFINNCSIGLYPHIVRSRIEQTERLGRGKWWAMFLASLAVFRRFPVLRVTLQFPDRSLTRTTPFVFIGNNEYEMNLLALGSRARVDGGILSLYVANRTGRFGLLRLAVRAILGRLDQAKDFDSMSLSEVLIETKRRRLSVALDGEVIRMKPPLKCRVRPGGLRVIVPPEEAEP
jgi:diacylglycerol kinase family enzyme